MANIYHSHLPKVLSYHTLDLLIICSSTNMLVVASKGT